MMVAAIATLGVLDLSGFFFTSAGASAKMIDAVMKSVDLILLIVPRLNRPSTHSLYLLELKIILSTALKDLINMLL